MRTRAIFISIALVAIGYLAWEFHRGWTDVPPALHLSSILPLSRSTTTPQPGPAVETPPSVVAAPTPVLRPGVYYVTQRVTSESPTAFAALNPGDEVHLMYVKKNGSMLVTDGHFEFTVKASLLKRDRESALRTANR